MSTAYEAIRVNENNTPDDRMDEHVSDRWERLNSEIMSGLLYTHARANANTSKALEIASFCYALIEILNEKGILTIEELDERKDVVLKRLVEKFREAGMGVMLQDPEQDKYQFAAAVKIDCENRIDLCKAACCGLSFALSRQDVEEGIVKWELGHPYMNARGTDAYCVHLERQAHRCAIYEERPLPCRAYDCRTDKRIWLDFDNRIVNPELDQIFNNGHKSRMADGPNSEKRGVFQV